MSNRTPFFAILSINIMAMSFAGLAFGSTIDTLPGYIWTGECQNVAAPSSSGCSESNGPSTGTSQFALNSATGPFLAVSDQTTNGFALGTNGDLTYFIEVNGPGTTALVDVNYLLTVSGSYTGPLGNDEAANIVTGAQFRVGPNSIAAASVNVDAFGGSTENGFAPSLTDNSTNATFSAQTGGWSGSLSGPDTIELTTGVAYQVELRAQAACIAQNRGNDTLSCSTSTAIDPTFAIDSSQTNAADYSIEFSPGIGNGNPSAAPEPGLLGTMAAGLIAIVVFRRRRQASQQSQSAK